MEFTKSQKSLLIIALCLLFGALVGGGYLLLSKSTKEIMLNKYPEILDWCENMITDSKLTFTCNALLINISSEGSNDSCFKTQIVTKDNKLQILTICENTDTLQYSNEILSYKKLLPIQINFVYQNTAGFNNYSFASIAISKLPENFVQEIVSNDINKLLTEDSKALGIKNSINLCPAPDSLPDYLSSQEKQAYSEYYDNNIMSNINSDSDVLYNNENPNIDILFACDNEIPNDSCTSKITLNTQPTFSQQPSLPSWSSGISPDNQLMIKQISMLYDRTSTFLPSYLPYMSAEDQSTLPTKTLVYQALIDEISNGGDVTEEAYCSLGHLLDKTQIDDNSYLEEMKSFLYSNIENSASPLCITLLDYSMFDRAGVYIKYYFSNKNDILSTYSRCINLASYLQ